jgi:hypothetical protein
MPESAPKPPSPLTRYNDLKNELLVLNVELEEQEALLPESERAQLKLTRDKILYAQREQADIIFGFSIDALQNKTPFTEAASAIKSEAGKLNSFLLHGMEVCRRLFEMADGDPEKISKEMVKGAYDAEMEERSRNSK